MQTEISFSDSYFRADFPNRLEHGNATTCVKSSASSILLSLMPTSFPYAVEFAAEIPLAVAIFLK